MASEEQFLQIIDSTLDQIADTIFSESQLNIVKNNSIDTGFLLKSGNVQREFLEKTITYSAPQAKWVEFGTEPHFPPVKAIQKWAERKLGLSEKEAKKVAWAISKHISKFGTEPKPFIRPAIELFLARGFK